MSVDSKDSDVGEEERYKFRNSCGRCARAALAPWTKAALLSLRADALSASNFIAISRLIRWVGSPGKLSCRIPHLWVRSDNMRSRRWMLSWLPGNICTARSALDSSLCCARSARQLSGQPIRPWVHLWRSFWVGGVSFQVSYWLVINIAVVA